MDKKQKKILCNIAFVMLITIITLLVLILLINTNINTEQIEISSDASLSEEFFKTLEGILPEISIITITIYAFKKALSFILNILYEREEKENV